MGLEESGVPVSSFGVMISVIDCYEGLGVTGDDEGVGRATAQTVVKSIVALITIDVPFTSILCAFEMRQGRDWRQ